MKSELSISLIQFSPVWEDVAANITKIEGILKEIPPHVDLVILPEMFSTGFSMSVEKFAEPMHGKTVTWMREMAIKGKKAITGSLIIEEEGLYYNRLLFVYPDGTYQSYDKRHLFRFGGEDKGYTGGRQRLIVNYLGWRICPLICYDLRFPVWSANRNDYDLLLYVANWPERRQLAWDILPLARAVENQSFVAALNRIGTDDNSTFYKGASKIISFKGEIIAASEQVQEEIITATLDFDHLHKFRLKYDFVRDADKFGIFD